MIVSDAQRRVREFWGPFSPKLYDGTWLEQHCFEIKTKFPNDTIIADNHFSWGRDHVEEGWPRFYANYAEYGKTKDCSSASVLVAEKKKYNRAVKHARARVESPFGNIKETWKILGKPFRGAREHHGRILTFAIGLHSARIGPVKLPKD